MIVNIRIDIDDAGRAALARIAGSKYKLATRKDVTAYVEKCIAQLQPAAPASTPPPASSRPAIPRNPPPASVTNGVPADPLKADIHRANTAMFALAAVADPRGRDALDAATYLRSALVAELEVN